MKKMYSFLIIVAAMTGPSCNDSKKSDTAETEKKPETSGMFQVSMPVKFGLKNQELNRKFITSPSLTT